MTLTETQEFFCEWNAERLGISIEESRKRYIGSLGSLPGGHRGLAYKQFMYLSYSLYQVLIGNTSGELMESYRFHAPLLLLSRVIRAEQPSPEERSIVLEHLTSCHPPEVRITDFGCGLAPLAQHFATEVMAQGVKVRLTLADISTINKSFLLWLCQKRGIPAEFVECSEACPLPVLPKADLCIATEFFEHVYDPVPYLDALDRGISPGGLLLTSTWDHKPEFLHVHPDLACIRSRLDALGYTAILPNRMYRKPAA